MFDQEIAARLEGYSWGEVDQHLADRTMAARAEGYDQQDINQYLGLDTDRAQFNAEATMRSRLSSDEALANTIRNAKSTTALTPLEGSSAERLAAYAQIDNLPAVDMPAADATTPPTGIKLDDEQTRYAYARSLLDGNTRSPRDFAERYLSGAAGIGGVDTLVRAAGELSSSLPNSRDFTDTAIAIAHRSGLAVDGDTVKLVRSNLIDYWAETGQDPMAAYKASYQDGDLADTLTAEKTPEPTLLERFIQAPLEVFKAEQDLQAWVGDRLRDWYAWRTNLPGVEPKDWPGTREELVQKLRSGEGLDEAMEVALNFGPQTLGRVGAKLAEAIGLLDKMPEPKVKVIDPAAPNGIVGEQPISKALELPKPAERLPVEPAATPKPPPSPLEFVPEATPAQKIQAIARDWTEKNPEATAEIRTRNGGELPAENDPQFFEKLAAGQDPATVELAKGHDAATGVFDYLRRLGADLAADESGALHLFRNPQSKADRAAYVDARDFARPLIIAKRSQGEQTLAGYGETFNRWQTQAGTIENVWKAVNKHMPEWERELDKGINGNPMGTVVGNMIDYIEGRSMGVAINHNSPLAPAADAIRAVNQAVEGELRAAHAAGTISYNSYFQDYFRHMWKDPNKAQRAFELYQGASRIGSSAGLQMRSIPTISDGLAMGLEPAIRNPLELTLFDAAQKIKYIKSMEIMQEANAAGYVKWRAAPHDGEVPLNVSPRTEKAVPGANPGIILKAYANPGFANAWNDWVSKGFHERPGAGATFFEKANYTINTFKGLSLALPVYHSIAMSVEAIGNTVARGAYMLGTGHPLQAAAEFGKAATVVTPPVEAIIKGMRWNRQYAQMNLPPELQHLVDAGARFGPRQEIYRMGAAPNVWDSIKRGELAQDYANQLKKLVKGDPNDPLDYRIAQFPRRLLSFAAYETGRWLNTFSAPVFDHLIPALKTGVNGLQMQDFIRNNPAATPAQIAKRASQIARNTDERMGEMNMDNIFWPRAVKQSAQTGMISLGWVYGNLRFLASAIGYDMERAAWEFNPVAARALVGFTAAYGIVGQAYQYLMTGKTAFDTDTPVHDLLVPRTGGVTTRGVPERALIPSPAKEIMDFYKIGAYTAHDPWSFPEHLKEYGMGKLPSLLQLGRALLTGEDAIGNKVGKTAEGWPGFIQKQIEPIFLNSIDQRKKGTGIPVWQTMMGVRPMTQAAEDPVGFYGMLERKDAKERRDQYNRRVYENKAYERPRPLPPKPSRVPSGASGPSLTTDEIQRLRILVR